MNSHSFAGGGPRQQTACRKRSRACSAQCIVIGTGTTSAIGKIKDALASTESAPTPLKRKLDEFGAFLSKAIAAICVVVWLVNIPNFAAAAFDGSWVRGAVYYFQTAVALAVAAIPEVWPQRHPMHACRRRRLLLSHSFPAPTHHQSRAAPATLGQPH